MTKYILNSGGIRNNPEGGKKFFAEMVRGLGIKPRILFCLFAYPRGDWEKKFIKTEEKVPEFYPKDVNPVFSLALPEIFEQQIKDTDIVYIYGGDDHLLQYWLRKFKVPEIWQGKVVASNSAGSDALVRNFWASDWRKCMDGLGILPVKFFPHFRSAYGNLDPRGPIDWQKAHKELEEYGDKTLPIYALKEGEYVVIEQ